MHEILKQINALLYPYILGYWSESNGGGFVVTTARCDQHRSLGGRKWLPLTTSAPNIYNTNLEIVTQDFADRGGYVINEDFFAWFLTEEEIEDGVRAGFIALKSLPCFLCLVGDLQGQSHYCLTVEDPMVTTQKQKVAFIFPGSQMDMYDRLPQEEETWASPMVGGSLGRLAHLPEAETIAGIEAAKKLLV